MKINAFKRALALCIAACLLSFGFAACNQKVNERVVRVNEVTHSIFYAPFYAAIENGFFEKHGLKIELTNGGGADKSMTAILSGAADIGLMGPEAAAYVYLNGKTDYPQVFAQLTKRDGSFLISRRAEDKQNFDISALNGKEIIAGRKGGVPAMTLEYLLKEHGLENGKNVTLNFDVQFALTAAAFEGGTGDYCTLFEPTASEFEKAGKGYVVESIGKLAGEVPYTAFMCLKSYIAKNEEIIKDFSAALYEGITFTATATNEELVKSLKGQFPAASDESIINSIERYRESDAWVSDLTLNENAFTRLKTIMQSAGELKGEVPYSALAYTKYSKS